MAHNIMDEKMFWSFNEPAWHKLGTVSKTPKFGYQVVEDLGGLYGIEVRPYLGMLNGVMEENGYMVVRSGPNGDSKEVKFGECTTRYKPVQPIEVVQTFDQYVGKPVETMGFLGKGEEMFISWAMPDFEIVKDTYKMYGIVRVGFDTKKGGNLFTAIYRPVCANTVTLAQNWAEENSDGKGKGMVYSGKHVNQNMLRDMGYWMKFVVEQSEKEADLVKSFFGKLASTPIKKDAEVHELLLNAYPPANVLGEYYPPELRVAKEDKLSDESEKNRQYRDNIAELFFGRGTAISNDYLGLMNATSEFFDHYLPSKKAVGESIMFGNRKIEIGKMVSVLKERV